MQQCCFWNNIYKKKKKFTVSIKNLKFSSSTPEKMSLCSASAGLCVRCSALTV